MATHAVRHHGERSSLPRWILTGLIAGGVSVLIFHQGVAELLYHAGVISNAPYPMGATQPFGVPAIWSMVFWGAVWGGILAATLSRLQAAALIAASIVFGAIVPTLIAGLIVAPIKHAPFSVGVALAVNAAWGLGTGLGLATFGRSRQEARRD